MLSLTDGFSIDGVDFFRDDEQKDTFYYLPTNIELARNADGSPQFQFVLYQAGLPIEGKQQGGGFLLFTTVLTAPADVIGPQAQTKAQSIMRAEAGTGVTAIPPAKIRPVNFINGSAVLKIARGGSNGLVTTVELGRPSLFGANTVSVLADMPFVGAQVFADVLRQGGAIASIEYNLEFEVRLPAVTITAHIEASRVRDAVAQFTTQQVVEEDFWGSDTTTETRKRTGFSEFLEERSLVELDIKSGSSEVELDDDIVADLRDFALGAMDKFINEEWLNVGGVLTDEQKQSEWLEFINEDFSKSFDLRMTQSDVILRPYNPSEVVDPSFIGADVSDYLTIVDTIAHPFFKRLEVDVSTSFDFDKYADYVHSIVVDIRYESPDDTGRQIEKAESFVFAKGNSAAKTFVTAKGTSNEYDVVAEVHYKNGPVLKQRVLDATSVNPAQVINVPNPGELNVTFSASPAGFAGDLESVDIELSYEDHRNNVPPFIESRSLTKEAPAATIKRAVYSPQMNPFRYRTTHVFPAQQISSPWIEVPSATNHLRVPTPFEDRLGVDIIPSVDWDEVQSVVVALVYEDRPNDIRVQQSFLFSVEDVGKVKLFSAPLKDPARREVSVEETHVLRNGAARNLPKRSFVADGAPLIVGNAPGGVYKLTILGDDIALGTDVRRVSVELVYTDAANSLRDTHRAFLRNSGETSIWTVAVKDPALLSFTYQADYLLASGDRVLGPLRQGSFARPDDLLFVEPPGV